VTKDEPSEASVAWDRMGQFLEESASVVEQIAERNLALWNDVSQRLRRGRPTADDLAAGAVDSVAAAFKNINDIWTALTNPPMRQSTAGVVPTAFLFFDRAPSGRHSLVDPVYVPVPHQVQSKKRLPTKAQIALDGRATQSSASTRGVASLEKRLHARLAAGKQGYLLETVDSADADPPLVAGVYSGLVYLADPPMQLASVRAVVAS
jgi:hypothetical protein